MIEKSQTSAGDFSEKDIFTAEHAESAEISLMNILCALSDLCGEM